MVRGRYSLQHQKRIRKTTFANLLISPIFFFVCGTQSKAPSYGKKEIEASDTWPELIIHGDRSRRVTRALEFPSSISSLVCYSCLLHSPLFHMNKERLLGISGCVHAISGKLQLRLCHFGKEYGDDLCHVDLSVRGCMPCFASGSSPVQRCVFCGRGRGRAGGGKREII